MQAALEVARRGAVVGRRPGRRGACSIAPARSSRSGHNERESDARPDRARRGARAAPGGAARRLLAADRLHAGRHARALHDVRRRRGPGPGRPAGLRRLGPEGRRRRFVVGRRARPPAQPPARGHRRRPRGGMLGAAAEFFAGSTFCFGLRAPAEAFARPGPRCRSGTLARGGVSERPKEHASKACEVQASVGSNPTATASRSWTFSHRHHPRRR